MATFSVIPSALRRNLSPQQTCRVCAKRQASKSARAKRRPQVEVELTTAVDKLGMPGQRVQVAPGRMRNHLYPSKMALYVLGGRTMQLDGTLSDLPSSSSSRSTTSSSPSSSPSSSSPPVLSSREILDQIDKLGPLQFERRTVKETIIHGSVTAQHVLAELQARGVSLTALEGEWQIPADVQGAVEQGRVKKLGQYIFNAKVHSTSYPIVVQVNEAQATEVRS